MRKIRHLSLLIILGGLSLSGIAFSSWITTNSNPSFDISVDVGDVITTNEYVLVDTSKGNDNSGISYLKYCEEGFINDSNYVDLTGKLVLYFIVDGEKTYDYYGGTNLANFTLNFSLSCYNENSITSLNIFNNSYFDCVPTAYYDQNSNYSQEKTLSTVFDTSETNTSKCSITTNSTDNLYYVLAGKNNVYFRFEYVFTIKSNIDFYNSVYNLLSNVSITCKVSLGGNNA